MGKVRVGYIRWFLQKGRRATCNLAGEEKVLFIGMEIG